jgi:uncharacterized membrane protein (DUF485 family)
MSPQPFTLKVLNVLSAVLVLVAFLMAMFYAPLEKVMGAVQKVFYFHVATAWVGMLGFIVAAVVAIIYLRTQNLKYHRRCRCGNQPGVLPDCHRAWFYLGSPGLGHLVDVGTAPHHCRHP